MTTPLGPSTDGSSTEEDSDTALNNASSTITSSSLTTTFSNASTTTLQHTSGATMDAGTGVAVAIVVAILFVGGVFVIYYLRKTGRFQCFSTKGRPRRSSTSSSRRALEPDDTESMDNMPKPTEGDMFAICEPEENEPEVAADDGYYYDEVFGSSAFEDETTKTSNKELFSVASDDEVPDLLLRIDRMDFK